MRKGRSLSVCLFGWFLGVTVVRCRSTISLVRTVFIFARDNPADVDLISENRSKGVVVARMADLAIHPGRIRAVR
jgi:hypothetical protein